MLEVGYNDTIHGAVYVCNQPDPISGGTIPGYCYVHASSSSDLSDIVCWYGEDTGSNACPNKDFICSCQQISDVRAVAAAFPAYNGPDKDECYTEREQHL